MSLNSAQMLPARVRSMRQMRELLDAEDEILTIFDGMIQDMYQRAEALHEELVNEAWLEKKLESVINGIVTVRKQEDSLQIEIFIMSEKLTEAEEAAVIGCIEKWLPAHLPYRISYERLLIANIFRAAIWQDEDEVEIRQVNI